MRFLTLPHGGRKGLRDLGGDNGYYKKRSLGFPALFGPTISAVREFTEDPILISETGAAAAVGSRRRLLIFSLECTRTNCLASCGSTLLPSTITELG